MKRKPPKRIWLQWHGMDYKDLLPSEKEDGPDLLSDVCWCQDKIFDTDIEYVRVIKKRKVK